MKKCTPVPLSVPVLHSGSNILFFCVDTDVPNVFWSAPLLARELVPESCLGAVQCNFFSSGKQLSLHITLGLINILSLLNGYGNAFTFAQGVILFRPKHGLYYS